MAPNKPNQIHIINLPFYSMKNTRKTLIMVEDIPIIEEKSHLNH